jgi:hypothetical protein
MKTSSEFLRSIAIAACLLGAVGAPAQAQVLAVGAALAGKKVSEIINELELTGSSLIAQAGATGNGLVSHAGNEANVLAKNVSFDMRDCLDQTFDRLDDSEKRLLRPP